MQLVEYPDQEMMMIDLANKLAGDLVAHLESDERASFAVPGGTTPGPIFDVICAADIDWGNVDIFLTDERWVPENDPRSNTRLLRERLLVERAARATYHPLYAKADTPEEGIAWLTPAIEAALPISVLLLGMGADMHTASLFPGADNLAAAMAPDAPVLLPMRAPGTGEARVTLTRPVLEGALAKHIVITGKEKREALDRAGHLDPMEAPIHAVWNGATVHWAE